jgi:hypothetical protein
MQSIVIRRYEVMEGRAPGGRYGVVLRFRGDVIKSINTATQREAYDQLEADGYEVINLRSWERFAKWLNLRK